MLKTNFLKNKLENEKVVIGTWSVIPSPVVSDVISASGLDFLIIDFEHGPISFETAQQMVMACESRNVSPVMRVGGLISDEILRALEIGVHCVHVPNITTVDEVKDIVVYSKYPPLGNRGFSPFTRAGGYGHGPAKGLHENANKSTLIAIHIEGREAFEQIESILEVSGIDIIFIGIYDLSKSLGIPGQVDHPLIKDMLQDVTKKITKARKYPGTIVTTAAQLQYAVEIGMKYITYSVDCEILLRGYRNIVHELETLTCHKVI
ncbi:MAG: hypothetical protein HQK60_18600 [Deltaproteobacteria bacterium]|nr:hypothetical protein [Deltaproteobacteria bacterium]